MKRLRESDSKRHVVRKREDPANPELFETLEKRGIDYEQVRQVVEFDLPQFPYFFARQFGDRTFKEVLEHIDDSKQFLKRNFLLTEDQKAKVAQMDSANGKSRLGSNPGRE